MDIQAVGNVGDHLCVCTCTQPLARVLRDGSVVITKNGLEVELEPETAFTVLCPRCRRGWHVDRELVSVSVDRSAVLHRRQTATVSAVNSGLTVA